MIIFRLLENARSSFEELLVNQQERENQRHEDFLNNTFRGFLGQVANMGSYDGLNMQSQRTAANLGHQFLSLPKLFPWVEGLPSPTWPMVVLTRSRPLEAKNRLPKCEFWSFLMISG